MTRSRSGSHLHTAPMLCNCGRRRRTGKGPTSISSRDQGRLGDAACDQASVAWNGWHILDGEKKGGEQDLWSPDAYFALSVTLTSAHNVLEASALLPSRRIESRPSKPNVAIAISSTCFPNIRTKPTTVVGVVDGAGIGNGGEKRCSVHEGIRAAWRLLSSGKFDWGAWLA